MNNRLKSVKLIKLKIERCCYVMNFIQFKAGETPKKRFVVMVSNKDYSKQISEITIVEKVTIFKNESKTFHKIYPTDSCWLDVIRFITKVKQTQGLEINEPCIFYHETHSISRYVNEESKTLPYIEHTYFIEGEYLFMSQFQEHF